MLWIYARGEQSLRLETSFDKDTDEFVLIFYRDDGSQQVERFSDAVSFQKRLDTVDKQLAQDDWRSSGAPVLLRDGWKI